jgi:hypothetical protein
MSQLKPSTRVLHYSLVLATSGAWFSAGLDGGGSLLHRSFGAAAAVLLLCGWVDFLVRRAGRRGAWGEGMRALGLQFDGSDHGRPEREAVLRMLIPVGLIVSSLVVLAGAPGAVRLDRVLHPAAWVLWLRQFHVLAGSGLLTLWMVDLGSLVCLWLHRLGRGHSGPAHPAG